MVFYFFPADLGSRAVHDNYADVVVFQIQRGRSGFVFHGGGDFCIHLRHGQAVFHGFLLIDCDAELRCGIAYAVIHFGDTVDLF